MDDYIGMMIATAKAATEKAEQHAAALRRKSRTLTARELRRGAAEALINARWAARSAKDMTQRAIDAAGTANIQAVTTLVRAARNAAETAEWHDTCGTQWFAH